MALDGYGDPERCRRPVRPGGSERAALVGRLRQLDDRAPRQSEAEVDAILLRKFAGRTLEELDQINWPRYMRAMEAERVMQVEERRLALLGGHIKNMSADDWELISENEEILKRARAN